VSGNEVPYSTQMSGISVIYPTGLDKIFFQGKKMHQLRKVGVHEHEDQIGFDFDLYLEQYELSALKSCLDTKTFDKLNINLGSNQRFLAKLKTGDPYGIVGGVTDDNQVIFNHQTYAEYFACAWLKKNLNKVSLLQDDLFAAESKNLMFMFNIMLAENSALHLAVIHRDTNLILNHSDTSEMKDEGGRSPLHLLCADNNDDYSLSMMKIITSLFRSGMDYDHKNKFQQLSKQYREKFKMLSQCDVFQKDNIFGWNCLEVSRQLDAENWTRENWSPQSGRATIGRMRQLDACDNWTVDACGMH
jgi:hypothetical protein